MAGFESIGEYAITEPASEGGGTEIIVGLPPQIQLTSVTGTQVGGGASANIPGTPLSLVKRLPEVVGGSNLVLSNYASFATISQSPAISGGGSVLSPKALISLEVNIPILQTGASQSIPSESISLVGLAPLLQVGSLIDVPESNVHISGQIPEVSHSIAVFVPTARLIQVISQEVDIGSGGIVDNPSRQDTYLSTWGSLTGDTIAEFAIGEGYPEITYSKRRTARLGVRSSQPIILAGSLIDVPVSIIMVVGGLPEINARRRRLRATVILS